MFALLKINKKYDTKTKIEKFFVKNFFATKITSLTQKISKNQKFIIIISKKMSITKKNVVDRRAKKRYYREKN